MSDDKVLEAARAVLADAVAPLFDRPAPPCCGHVTCKGDGRACGYVIAGFARDSVRCTCTGEGK